LSEFAPSTAPPFSGITPPANPQAEPGYIIWLCTKVRRAARKGSQAASNPPIRPRLGRSAPPGRPNLPHSEEVRRETTHICCRFTNPLLKARFAKGLRKAVSPAISVSGPKQVADPAVGRWLQFGYPCPTGKASRFSCVGLSRSLGNPSPHAARSPRKADVPGLL